MQGIKSILPREYIIQEYSIGKSTPKIAEQFDVDPKTISNWLCRWGCPTRYKGQKHIDPKPTKELAYLFGLILGDGWIYHNCKTNNYGIYMESINEKQINNFTTSINSCFPTLSTFVNKRNKERKFGSKIYKGITYIAGTTSVELFNLIAPFKQKDYKWSIPDWIITNNEYIYGFLDGIIEAEGSFHKSTRHKLGISRIHIISKHKSNLKWVEDLLKNVGIDVTYTHSNTSYSLNINRKEYILKIFENCPKCLRKVKVIKEKNKGGE